MKRVSMDELVRFGVAFMTKRGVPDHHATYVAHIIVETEAFRQSTHGLAQYAEINTNLGKLIDPRAEPKIMRDRGSIALVDGDRCLGNLAMKLAKELAVNKAREHGAGFVTVRNTEWIGALGMHLISMAQEGLLAQAWAQSSTCEDCAPYGGIDARFSTNPIAFAFPTTGNPVVGDFSTATMSVGAAYALIRKGEKTPTPRFLDKRGHSTDDPGVMQDSGTLMFVGGEVEGHKGYALSLLNEALTVLGGGSANNPQAPSHQSFALMALDPAAFAGPDYYLKEMERFLDHVKSSHLRPGFDRIRLPGERGFTALQECRVHGIPLDDDKLLVLRNIAHDNGIEPVG
jgi:L-lactate dehydrogenase